MTSYITASKTGPKGRQTGYVVQAIDTGEVVATFTNKKHGYWRFAKTAAERECDARNYAKETTRRIADAVERVDALLRGAP